MRDEVVLLLSYLQDANFEAPESRMPGTLILFSS